MPAHPAHPAQTTTINASRIFTPCTTACTPCTDHDYQRLTNFHTLHNCLHTLHKPYLIKKMKKIICGEENVKAFNGQMRELVPEFHSLAKQLHSAGLINGLRGATLEIAPLDPQPVIEQPAPEAKKQCQECAQWVRDPIGFGAGIGECLLNSRPSVLKWPKQTACWLFEEKA
jgi:hypothetical protein